MTNKQNNLLRYLDLTPLTVLLTLSYVFVEGTVPALTSPKCITPARAGRRIRPKDFIDFAYINTVEKHSCKHDRGFKINQAKTEHVPGP